MSSIISPEIRDLQQKYEDLRTDLARTQNEIARSQGEIEAIKQNTARNDRQTNRQFVIFLVTMTIAVAGSLIGTSIFQTESLRREMDAKFGTVNQRIDGVEKRMERIEKTLDEISKELRSQRK